jgi:hypothetical protein
MTERADLIKDLAAAMVLPGIRWAYESATARLLEDYSEPAGYDEGWIGTSRWVLFRDRLDRVFSCGRYTVADAVDASLSMDVLNAELPAREISSRPVIAPGVVVRSNLNGSPGWSFGGVRWLLASGKFGKLDEHPWPQKSPTKQRVAMQPATDSDHPTLFDDFEDDEQGGLLALPDVAQLDLETLIVGHTLAADHGGKELVIGKPRLNFGGGAAWHWMYDLLQSPPPDGGRVRPTGPVPSAPDGVPDAPVKLRPAVKQRDLGAQ